MNLFFENVWEKKNYILQYFLNIVLDLNPYCYIKHTFPLTLSLSLSKPSSFTSISCSNPIDSVPLTLLLILKAKPFFDPSLSYWLLLFPFLTYFLAVTCVFKKKIHICEKSWNSLGSFKNHNVSVEFAFISVSFTLLWVWLLNINIENLWIRKLIYWLGLMLRMWLRVQLWFFKALLSYSWKLKTLPFWVSWIFLCFIFFNSL